MNSETKIDYVALAQPFKERLQAQAYDLPSGLSHQIDKWIDHMVAMHIECIKGHMDMVYILSKFEEDDDRREQVLCHLYALVSPFNGFIQEMPNPLDGPDKLWGHIQRFYQGLSERLVKE